MAGRYHVCYKNSMRFRVDGWHYADIKAAGIPYAQYLRTEEEKHFWETTPRAEPGDVWRIFWYHRSPGGPQVDDRLAGYAIGCPGCHRVHAWTTANNCGAKIRRTYIDLEGKEVPYESCVHNGFSSCWTWTGSAEEGTLSASPSLLVTQSDCHWHGWLRNGSLLSCAQAAPAPHPAATRTPRPQCPRCQSEAIGQAGGMRHCNQCGAQFV